MTESSTSQQHRAETLVPAPGAKARAIAEEQQHLDLVHNRVDELRKRASLRVKTTAAQRFGSTFQAQFERDVITHHHAARAARFTFGDVESLAFGRLDRIGGDTLHIGRLSVIAQDGDVLLVDWRAPAAASFYQATAAHPDGVIRRRVLTTRGRVVIDLDDEVLDAEAADVAGIASVTGQGALLSSLQTHSDGRMRQIVATIQADQDAIIRAPAVGTTLVTGGPGTGKTVVALHRVAYLLYRDRQRFSQRGVLVVGPSPAFTAYTANVLPSLGEDRVVQRPIGWLCAAGVTAERWDDAELARIKGSPQMIVFARRLLADSLPALPEDFRFTVDGVHATVKRRALERLRQQWLARVDGERPSRTYRQLAGNVEDGLRRLAWDAWRRVRSSLPTPAVTDPRDVEFHESLAENASFPLLRGALWPALDAEDVLRRCVNGSADVAALLAGLLSESEIAALTNDWQHQRDWSVGDIAVIDELAALLGVDPVVVERQGQKTADPRSAWNAAQQPAVSPSDLSDPHYRDFAHVVVDEAQELTTLQWRSLARRGAYASWTVVGDLAQRSAVGPPASWQEITELIGRQSVAHFVLDVNYRTPAEIAVAAEAIRVATQRQDAAPSVDDHGGGSRAIRHTGRRPRLIHAQHLAAATVATVKQLLARADGTVGIVCPENQRAAVDELLSGVSGPGIAQAPGGHEGRTDGLSRVLVLDARTAKGLEFDDVVVVDPEAIVATSPAGLHDLYVAVTRATRSLHVVAGVHASLVGAEHYDVTRWEES